LKTDVNPDRRFSEFLEISEIWRENASNFWRNGKRKLHFGLDHRFGQECS